MYIIVLLLISRGYFNSVLSYQIKIDVKERLRSTKNNYYKSGEVWYVYR